MRWSASRSAGSSSLRPARRTLAAARRWRQAPAQGGFSRTIWSSRASGGAGAGEKPGFGLGFRGMVGAGPGRERRRKDPRGRTNRGARACRTVPTAALLANLRAQTAAPVVGFACPIIIGRHRRLRRRRVPQVVQQAIADHGEEVWPLLQQDGIVFVCGEASRMAPEVRQAFIDLFVACTGAAVLDGKGLACGACGEPALSRGHLGVRHGRSHLRRAQCDGRRHGCRAFPTSASAAFLLGPEGPTV